MMDTDLFPETTPDARPTTLCWPGQLTDAWGHVRVEVRLIALWDTAAGLWRCGWLAQVDKALDEYHPADPDKHRRIASYPWFRPAEMAASRHQEIALAGAARSLLFVLEQMLPYADDTAAADEARGLQAMLQQKMREWLA